MIITVVGLGVVGGSFVKALKGQGHEVYGVDVDEETLARAKADGCIKEGFVEWSRNYQKIGYDDYLFISIISFRLYKKT